METKQYMHALGSKLIAEFPERVKIEYKKEGFFSKKTFIYSVSVFFGNEVFEFFLDSKMQLRARKHRFVKEIRLKSEDIIFSEGIKELEKEINEAHEEQKQNRFSLEDYLKGF